MTEYLIQESTLTEIADAVRAKTKKTDAILVSDLVNEITGISTGVELNFDVVGGATQPLSPSENTIWVNTNQEITSWVFSATQPSNPIEGMVWISIGTTSAGAFNALKKDGIQVYPMSAKQYISGVWVEKTAQTYKDGVWVPWIKSFTFNLDITKWATVSGKTFSNSFKNNEDNSLTFATSKNTAVSNEYAGKYYSEPIDLTDYDKLVLDLVYTLHSGNAKCNIYFSTTPTGSEAAMYDTGFNSTSGEKILNVSQLTGKYYLVLRLYAGYNGQSTLQINSAKLTEVL